MRERRSKGPNFQGKIGRSAQRQKREGKSYGYLILPKKVNVFKEEVTAGRTRIDLDILPYLVTSSNHPDKEEGAVKGEYWYRRPYWVHHNVGTGNKTMICPKTFGNPCPICEYRQNQFKDENIKKDQIIPKPQMKNIYAVVVLNHKDYDKTTIYIWDIAHGNFQSTLIDDLAERPELEIFPNLEDGLTLSIRFNEEVFNKNKFAQAGRIDYIERDYSYPESILEQVPALDEILKVSSYKEIEEVFLGIDDENEEEEQEEKQPAQRQRKTIDRISKQEDPDEESEEPEEEEKPRRGPVSTLSRQKTPTPTRRRREKEEPETESVEGCPKDHTFGKDWDDFPDCEGCPVFEECGTEYERLNS
jgi:hypothetical protein